MADIDIELEKKSKSDINATVQFETYGEVVEVDSENDIYTSGTQTNIELNPECIEIEITGLKSFDTFIGLTDTPLYYENGKFFKVENNKIIYTDITWADLQGQISENPDLEEQIKDIAKQYNEQFVKETIDNSIDIHDKNIESHKFIQDIITNNYTTLDNKIDVNINNLTNNIDSLEIDIVGNEENINTLFGEQVKTQESILTINKDIQNNSVLIQNTRKDLRELDNETKISLSELNTELNLSNNKITNNTDNIERNFLLISDIINDLKEYVKKNNLSDVAFSGDYDDLLNLPDIPSLDGYATINYVNQKIDDAIGQISGFDFLVVDKLPEIGESGHIYLVRHQHGDKDIYDEYIWVQSIQDFEKIGNTDLDLSEYYTKSEINDNLNKKVDKLEGYSLISDIEIERLSNINNYDDTNIRYLIDTKQNILTAGDNIDIENNIISAVLPSYEEIFNAKSDKINTGSSLNYSDSLLELKNISGDTISQVIIKSVPDIDNKTIDYNDSEELQTIGIFTQDKTYKKEWIGTKEEYEKAISDGIIDKYTECRITDDYEEIVFDINLSAYATKDELNTKASIIDVENTYLKKDDAITKDILLNENFDVLNTDSKTIIGSINEINNKEYITNEELEYVKLDIKSTYTTKEEFSNALNDIETLLQGV